MTKFERKLAEFHDAVCSLSVSIVEILAMQQQLRILERERAVTKLAGGCLLIRPVKFRRRRRQRRGA